MKNTTVPRTRLWSPHASCHLFSLAIPTQSGGLGISESAQKLASRRVVHLRWGSPPNTWSSIYLWIALCEESCTRKIRSTWHPGSSRRPGPCGSHTHAVRATVQAGRSGLALLRYESAVSWAPSAITSIFILGDCARLFRLFRTQNSRPRPRDKSAT